MKERYGILVSHGHYEREMHPDGNRMSNRYVDDGQKPHLIELEIDEKALAHWLGSRAVKNKRRQATAVHGLIVAREVK